MANASTFIQRTSVSSFRTHQREYAFSDRCLFLQNRTLFKPYYRRFYELLGNRKEGEGELRAIHFFLRVFVPSFEAWQAAHTHHQELVTDLECDTRGLGGDFHLDPETRLHDIDTRFVRGIEADANLATEDPPCLFDVKLALADRAIGGKHAGRDSESEVCLHGISPTGV